MKSYKYLSIQFFLLICPLFSQNIDISSLLHKTESCNALNVLISFLFRELKDASFVRRWVVRKMNVEFEELLTTKAAGKILEQITVSIKKVSVFECVSMRTSLI